MTRLQKWCFAGVAVATMPYLVLQLRVWSMQEVYNPILLPISLHRGQVIYPKFRARVTTGYQLQLEFDRAIEFDRMECLLGLTMRGGESKCEKIPEIDDVQWTVLSGGRAVASGSSRDQRAASYSDTIAKIIGHFDAVDGSVYWVRLTVRRDASELDKANPRLRVETFPSYWEGTIILRQLSFYWLAFCAGAGLLAWLATAASRRAKARARAISSSP